MEIVKMEEEDILRCTSCGLERPLIAVEPWDPMEGKLVKAAILAGIIATIVLWVVIYSTILVHY
jgi:ribosome maturation factor RimP